MNYLYTQHYQIAHNTLVPSRYLAYNDLKSTYPINIIQHNIHTDPSDKQFLDHVNSNSFRFPVISKTIITDLENQIKSTQASQVIEHSASTLSNDPYTKNLINQFATMQDYIKQSLITLNKLPNVQTHPTLPEIINQIKIQVADIRLNIEFDLPLDRDLKDININGVTFNDWILDLEILFQEYDLGDESEFISEKCSYIFRLIDLFNKLAIKPEDHKNIHRALINMFTILRAELAQITPRKGRKKSDANKTIKPSQYRNGIKVSLEKVIKFLRREISMIRDAIQNHINDKSDEIIVNIIEPLDSYIAGFSNSFLGYFTKDRFLKNPNDGNHSEILHNLFNRIIRGPINEKVLTINLLLSLEVGKVYDRLKTLDQESPFTIGISNILAIGFLGTEDKQYLIEAFSYDYQRNFFKYMIENATSSRKIVIFQEFHGKLINGFKSLLSRYTKNNKAIYNSLLEDGLERRVIDILTGFKDHDAVVSISFSTLLNIITAKGLSRQEVCNQIGRDVLKFYNIEHKDNRIRFDNDLIMQIGLILLENILLRLPILETNNINETKNGKVTTKTMITLKPNFTELFVRNKLNPMLLPMVNEPKKWNSKSELGGYILPEMRYIANVDHGFVHENPANIGKSVVSNMQIQAINQINSIGFQINNDLLQIYLDDFLGPGNLFNGYNKLHEDSNKTISIHSKKYQEIQAHNGLYWTYYNILNLANLYRNHTIYIPTFMDFRGRIYPYVSYLNYQGSDLARSLLHFAKTEEVNLEGYKYIEYYLAALYGHSNKSFAVRSEWVGKNLENMIYKFETDRSAWLQDIMKFAKEPYQFISVFMEIMKLMDNADHRTGLPVLFDCSCSGIQHLSTLCQDISLAKMVNVIGDTDRADLYEIAANHVKSEIASSTKPGIVEARPDLSRLIINRDVLKTPIMTISYNISLSGLTEQLVTKLSIKTSYDVATKKVYYHINPKYVVNGGNLLLSGSAMGHLASLVYNSLFKLSPNLKTLVAYFNSMIKLLYQLNLPVIWLTPGGMHINLSSIKYDSVKTKTVLFRGTKPITLQIPTNKLDTEKIRRGFMPNMVHSMDAANIHILVNNLIRDGHKLSFYTIHDCFATTPNNMSILNDYTKAAFMEMYLESNYLEKFHRSILEQISSFGVTVVRVENDGICYLSGDHVLEIPKFPKDFIDTWNKNKSVFIEGLKKAEYFIS
jgi:hypothetical protein